MGRFTSFLGSGKSVAATTAQVITFTGNDLPSAGVVAYHFVTAQSSGATDVADITRIRVKADNRLIYDVGLTHFRKWQERFSTVGYALPTALTRWTIPFNLFDIVDDDLADTCQFPRGTVPTVEITLGTGSAAGSIYAGWTQTDAKPVFYPTLIGQQMNIASSAVNATFPINSQGAVRGMMVDTAGLSRFKAELNGGHRNRRHGFGIASSGRRRRHLRRRDYHDRGRFAYSDGRCVARFVARRAGYGFVLVRHRKRTDAVGCQQPKLTC